MDEPKRYEIQSLADMGQIPLDRLDAFLADLKATLIAARSVDGLARATGEAITAGALAGQKVRLEVRAGLQSMTWTDDGIHAIGFPPAGSGSAGAMEGGGPAKVNRVPGHRLREFTEQMDGFAEALRGRTSPAPEHDAP